MLWDADGYVLAARLGHADADYIAKRCNAPEPAAPVTGNESVVDHAERMHRENAHLRQQRARLRRELRRLNRVIRIYMNPSSWQQLGTANANAKLIERNTELQLALGVPRKTPWPELVAAVRALKTGREATEALRAIEALKQEPAAKEPCAWCNTETTRKDAAGRAKCVRCDARHTIECDTCGKATGGHDSVRCLACVEKDAATVARSEVEALRDDVARLRESLFGSPELYERGYFYGLGLVRQRLDDLLAKGGGGA
jgi:hypothetical protein